MNEDDAKALREALARWYIPTRLSFAELFPPEPFEELLRLDYEHKPGTNYVAYMIPNSESISTARLDNKVSHDQGRTRS
jgi:hypothetical protein